MRSPRGLPAAALVAVLPLAACGADDAEDIGGNPGPDAVVSEDIEITALQLAFPEDGLWAEGEDVPLYAAITNTGTTGDRLVDVRGEGFGDAALIGRSGTEGSIEILEENNAYLEPEGPPSVLLLDLDESLRSSQSVEVTFVFEEAGEVTMEAPVAADPPGEGDFTAPEDPTGEG